MLLIIDIRFLPTASELSRKGTHNFLPKKNIRKNQYENNNKPWKYNLKGQSDKI